MPPAAAANCPTVRCCTRVTTGPRPSHRTDVTPGAASTSAPTSPARSSASLLPDRTAGPLAPSTGRRPTTPGHYTLHRWASVAPVLHHRHPPRKAASVRRRRWSIARTSVSLRARSPPSPSLMPPPTSSAHAMTIAPAARELRRAPPSTATSLNLVRSRDLQTRHRGLSRQPHRQR